MTEQDIQERFDEMLDEVYGDIDGMISVAGYRFPVSAALRKLDPIAYRCGLSDYEDDMERFNDEEDEDDE
jgi:hypothetical protein